MIIEVLGGRKEGGCIPHSFIFTFTFGTVPSQ